MYFLIGLSQISIQPCLTEPVVTAAGLQTQGQAVAEQPSVCNDDKAGADGAAK